MILVPDWEQWNPRFNVGLTKPRRIIKGSPGDASKEPINPLRDGDQPFDLDIRFLDRPYRLKFYDTASPENWTLLEPNVVVLCYDISSRPSLVNIKNRVGLIPFA